MIRISREEGKQLSQICPEYVFHTVHKRSYYLVEDKPAFVELDKIRRLNKIIETYPQKRKGDKQKS